MNTVAKTLAGVIGASLLAAVPALANSDVNGELAELRAMMEGLQQKVQAQDEQLEHQGELLKDAQQVVREQQRNDETLSGIAEFWQAIDVNMSVAGSYAHNFNQPTNSVGSGTAIPAAAPPGFPGFNKNQGVSGSFYPFHGDHNSFQVDQVYFDIGKAPTEESRGGFHFTLLYGNTAGYLGQGGNLVGTFGGAGGTRKNLYADSTSDYYIHQAYVSWLVPALNVQVDVGKFATLVGAEVADTTQNFNITMGNVYNLLQPIDHVGALASMEAGPLSLATGVVNQGDLTVSSPDINKGKTFIGKVGFGDDAFSVATTILYGSEGGALGYVAVGDNSQKEGLLDLLATFNAGILEAWINGDYVWVEGSAASAWGVAAAGRLSLTDQLKLALRAEYARDKGSNTAGGLGTGPIFGLSGSGAPGISHAEVYGLTGTLSYELAESLTLRGEIRWDRVNQRLVGTEVEEFLKRSAAGGGSRDQVVGLAQLIYAF